MKIPAIPQNFFTQLNTFGKMCKKINSLILVLFIVFPFISYGQKGETAPDKELAPVRGNYKIFESLSPKPKSANLDIDKLKFPFDQTWADKVLRIKPVYLTNISTNDFKLPDPPANS